MSAAYSNEKIKANNGNTQRYDETICVRYQAK